MIAGGIFIVSLIILLKKLSAIDRIKWGIFFLIKVLFLWFFLHIHKENYSHYFLDYEQIFADASLLSDLLWSSPKEFWQIIFSDFSEKYRFYLITQPRAFFTAKLFCPIVLIAQKNLFLTSLYALLLYLAAVYSLVRVLQKLFPRHRFFAYCLLLVPSLQFWTSATSKELWLLICIYGISAVYLEAFYLNAKILPCTLKGSILFWILWKLKYYYAFGIAFAFLVELGVRLLHNVRSFWQKWLLGGTVVLGLLSLVLLHPNLHWDYLPQALYENYRITLEASPKGSAIELGLEPSWLSCIENSYKGLWIGLFAPMWWQAKNWAMFLASLENLFLLIGGVYASIYTWQNKTVFRIEILITASIFVILMASFLGLSSPNFGAISRYRVGFSWILWLWISFCVEEALQRRNIKLFHFSKGNSM